MDRMTGVTNFFPGTLKLCSPATSSAWITGWWPSQRSRGDMEGCPGCLFFGETDSGLSTLTKNSLCLRLRRLKKNSTPSGSLAEYQYGPRSACSGRPSKTSEGNFAMTLRYSLMFGSSLVGGGASIWTEYSRMYGARASISLSGVRSSCSAFSSAMVLSSESIVRLVFLPNLGCEWSTSMHSVQGIFRRRSSTTARETTRPLWKSPSANLGVRPLSESSEASSSIRLIRSTSGWLKLDISLPLFLFFQSLSQTPSVFWYSSTDNFRRPSSLPPPPRRFFRIGVLGGAIMLDMCRELVRSGTLRAAGAWSQCGASTAVERPTELFTKTVKGTALGKVAKASTPISATVLMVSKCLFPSAFGARF
mmetsp:Transcript_16999/g.64768  ORF Transcript_16999/g.64768 Transcript_16999/m.64768 type:complete len:363 (+) Transcript_16999:307-1395(+)